MGKPLSVDLRQRILEDIDQGLSTLVTARKFRVARRTVDRLLQHRRKTGSLEPIRGHQGRKPRLEHVRQEILQAIRQNPGLTLTALKSQLSLNISLSGLWRTLRRWGLRLKKSPARRRTAAA